MRNILQSIADLGQIMKDLSVLVIDQGTILDRIDYNMEQARSSYPDPIRVICVNQLLPWAACIDKRICHSSSPGQAGLVSGPSSSIQFAAC